MIKQENVRRGEIPDSYIQMTITGKVNNNLHVKEPVELEDIFQIDESKGDSN